MSSSVICPIFSFNLLLSKVLTCSNKTTESLFSPYSSDEISTCVGNLALFICEVIADTITVGLLQVLFRLAPSLQLGLNRHKICPLFLHST